MSKNVVVVNNSLFAGGMISYNDYLCLGLVEMLNRGEIGGYKLVIPYHIMKGHGDIPKEIPTYIMKDRSDTFMTETDEEYFSHLKDADVIITIAHGMDDGFDRVDPSFFAGKDVVLIIHSTADFTKVRKVENYINKIAMRHKLYNKFVMYREKLMEGLPKIQEKFGWTHLMRPDLSYILNKMGMPVTTDAVLPSEKPNVGIFYGRCNNSQKRFTRILKGLEIYNPFEKFIVGSNPSNGENEWSSPKLMCDTIDDLKSKGHNVELNEEVNSVTLPTVLKGCRVAVLPSQYKDIGYPLEWVVSEAIVNKVVPIVTDYVAQQCEIYAPGFKFITIPEGWDDIDFHILDGYTPHDLDTIAQHNYDLYASNYTPYHVARNIINKETVLRVE